MDCYQYVAKTITNNIKNKKFNENKEILLLLTDNKKLLEKVPYEILLEYLVILQKKYSKKYDDNITLKNDIIDNIIQLLDDDKYVILITKHELPNNFSDDVEHAYFDFDVDIDVFNKNRVALLKIKITGSGTHYVSGSINTDVDKFNVDFTHNCKTSKEFDDIFEYLENNKDVFHENFDNTVIENEIDEILVKIKDDYPIFKDIDDNLIFNIEVIEQYAEDKLDEETESETTNFIYIINIYDEENNIKYLSAEIKGELLITKLDYDMMFETTYLHKSDNKRKLNQIINYFNNNIELLNEKLKDTAIEDCAFDILDDFENDLE